MSKARRASRSGRPEPVRRRFLILDVFTARAFGGNQLAVLPDASGLSGEAMQVIAREFNFSETSFVLPSTDADAHVRIFTPAYEMPFAGHPTIGTALALAWERAVPQAGNILLLEAAGPVRVELSAEDGRAASAELTAPQLPRVLPGVDLAHCAQALGLEVGDLGSGWPDAPVVTTGAPFLIVPIATRAALGRARLRDPSLLDGLIATGVYLVTPDAAEPGIDWQVRMFAPGAGVGEDPATGSAAAAFAGLLAHTTPEPEGHWRWRIAQGIEMGRPSLIEASAEKHNGVVTAVRVAGRAVLVAEGEIETP